MNDDIKNNLHSLKIDKSKKYNDRPKSKKMRWVVIALILIVAIASYFVFKERIKPATKIKTATVVLLTGSDSQASLVATGYVVAQRKAEVASKGTGRLKYLGFEEGDVVNEGDTIAEIENDDIKASLELARANLMKAEADSLNAGRIYRRQQSLFKSGSVTGSVLEDAQTGFEISKANVAAANASLKAAEVELDNTYIKAPFTGTILTKNADIGEIVAPFASSASSKGSVVTLADMGSLEVEADVSESNIYKVSVGQNCEIILDAYPSASYEGYVKKIVPTADRARATVLTKVRFKNKDDKVLPEMSARVNFFDAGSEVKQYDNVLTIPKDAITNRNDQKVVFKIIEDYVTLVPVQLGRELGKNYEILSGLDNGDRVVLNPPGKMIDGEKIEISN